MANQENGGKRWITRAWKLARNKVFKGTELEGATVQVPVLNRTDSFPEAVSRVAEACGYDLPADAIDIEDDVPPAVARAMIDAVNDQGIALAKQKAATARADDDEHNDGFPTEEALQDVLDSTVLEPKERLVGGASKKKVREKRGKRVEELLDSPDVSDGDLETLRRLGLA